jgi:hypothetical protein
MLAEPAGDDRSAQTHALVAAAVEWGLDDGQVLSLLDQHVPSLDKYGDRTEREIERVLSKVRPDHQHPGKPCDKAGCANRPRWMTGTERDRATGAGESSGPPTPITGTDGATPEPPPLAGWEPVDLGGYLDGSYTPPVPSLLARRDGACLMYPGRVHWLSGEPEAGKTWLVLLACAQVLAAGGRVVYIDLEDGPGGMTSRLLSLGVPATAMRERFTYLNPPGALSYTARTALEPLVAAGDLLVVDACTESLAAQGLSSKDDVDIAKWLELLPRWASRLGPAVAVLDHVVKDAESRGRWATGSQHKLSGLDGVAFSLETVHPAGRGLTGRSRLFVAKDRHGQVRGPMTVPTAGARHWAGDLVVDSSSPELEVVLHPPSEQIGPFRPTVVMQRVSEALAGAGRPLSGRDVIDRVSGKQQVIRQALALLVDEGHVEVTDGPNRAKLHRLVRPFPTTDGKA